MESFSEDYIFFAPDSIIFCLTWKKGIFAILFFLIAIFFIFLQLSAKNTKITVTIQNFE